MRVTVNGVAATVDEGLTVATLVQARAEEGRHVAVALNGEVVPRAAWQSTRLAAGDSVEVLAPAAGG